MAKNLERIHEKLNTVSSMAIIKISEESEYLKTMHLQEIKDASKNINIIFETLF